ncbi:MAG: alpha-glucuronidase, partial [Cohnella sp.]|nr:alpha-glucuronidase [Cohnella sp.]
MNFAINRTILNSGAFFLNEKEAYSGVRKISDKVMKDIERVFGASAMSAEESGRLASCAVIYGTIDRSPMLESLSERGLIDLEAIRGKNEVYLFQTIDAPLNGVDKALVIAGSDKRGTIYGLFHLSELLGVSPYVDWCDVMPPRRDEFVLD